MADDRNSSYAAPYRMGGIGIAGRVGDLPNDGPRAKRLVLGDLAGDLGIAGDQELLVHLIRLVEVLERRGQVHVLRLGRGEGLGWGRDGGG